MCCDVKDARGNSHHALAALLRAGANGSGPRTPSGASAARIAAGCGNLPCLQVLADAGVSFQAGSACFSS
eukprot:2509851-Alexandrium_andersonii.AAC.1